MHSDFDLRGLDPDHLDDDLRARNAHAVSDVAFLEAVARVVARPRRDAPDSFVLHAPLELLARAALLPRVSPERRHDARRQMASIAARFDAFGPAMDVEPVDMGVDDAVRSTKSALADGDQDRAAAAATTLGRRLDAGSLTRAVADAVAPSLAAAAHAPIFLHHLPRAAPRSPLAGAMFGTLARELARNPGWRLRWIDQVPRSGSGRGLGAALASTPVLGPPESTFIFPLMSQADDSGIAADVIGPALGADTDLAEATCAILRVATASMLLDDQAHAAYGWSHCLTIPQGLLSAAAVAADPLRLVAIAATHVVGFRAGEGSAPLAELAGDGLDETGLLGGLEPPTASALQEATDHAAAHEDAHLVKYLVSCLDAARTDPDGAAQHLRAAVHLSDLWRSGAV